MYTNLLHTVPQDYIYKINKEHLYINCGIVSFYVNKQTQLTKIILQFIYKSSLIISDFNVKAQ